MKIENFEISKMFRSYGTTFWQRLSKVSELFSKIEFSNDFGIFTVERYMLIVLGKIAKRVLRRLEVFVKYEDVFSLRFLSAGPSHLPGERDVAFIFGDHLGILATISSYRLAGMPFGPRSVLDCCAKLFSTVTSTIRTCPPT